MKKKFVKVSLFCALVATASVGFVACADYDDDIKNLQTQVDANKTLAETLDAQIQDLKKALETANADIQAAKDAAAAAQDAADKASELAKQAAAEAKAEAIEEATKLVEALKADIEAKNYATTEDLNAAINTVNTKIASVEDGLNKQIESINGTIDGLVVDVDKAEELIAELQTQKLAVETFEQYKKDAALEIDSLDEKIDSVKTELDKAIADAEQNAKDYTDQEIEKLKTDLEKQITAVNANLVTLLTQSLRSLVFVPNLFVDGIEAVEYDYLPYKPFKTFQSTKSGEGGDKGTDEGEAFEINGIYGDGGYSYDYKLNNDANELYINPTIDVEYKMNPSSVSQASIEKMDWSILERDVEVVSRGAVAEKDQRIHVTKVAKSSSEAGSLVLSLWADGVKINSQSNKDLEIEHESGNGEDDATIFALQSKKAGDDETPDQIVTSDYAMLYASQLKLRAIAYSDGTTVTPVDDADGNNADCSLEKDGKTTELYEAPVHAIKNPASFQIQYNATDLVNSTLKLKEKIQIHYDWISNTGKRGLCKKMSLKEAVDKYGFKVKFNRVNYTVGSASKTADSQYLLMNEDGELAVCGINSDGSQNTNDKNPVDAIGRHPLVQVLLTKEVEEGGKMVEKVVLDGYIKIAIKREIKNKETACFDLGNVAFGCGPVAKSVTWSQISAQLLREAAVTSREEFDALYRIETTSDDEIAQYVRDNEKYDAVNGIFEYVQLSADKDQLVGKVTDEADAETGTSTTILTWTLENVCDMQQVYESTADEGERSGSLDHAKTIYVKYVPRVENPDATSEYPGIFLPLTIGVDKPQASVSERIDEYWYNDMDNWYGRYDGVHVNVQQPMDNSDTKQFVYNLYSAWVGNKITFSGVSADFTSYSATILEPLTYATNSNSHGGHMFYFRPENENKEILGVDGKTYVLSVASTQVIKKCDGTPVSVAKGELTPEFEKDNALKGKEGVYANNALYARVKGTAATENVMVAEIQQGIDTYTNAPTLIIDNNSTTKAILNTYAHDDAKSWTAFIGITAMSSPCDVTLSLTDNVYPARIQRPVDIKPVEGSVFTDAEENSSIVDLFDLFDYSDWRNVKFINGDDITKAWLFAYYGFKSATADIDGITTTMNGGVLGETLLSSVSKEVIFEQIENKDMTFSNVTAANYLPIYNKVRSSFGKIKYDNNRGNVQNFKVRIPVDFEYEWGTIRVYVDCDVKNTMGND